MHVESRGGYPPETSLRHFSRLVTLPHKRPMLKKKKKEASSLLVVKSDGMFEKGPPEPFYQPPRHCAEDKPHTLSFAIFQGHNLFSC